MDLPSGYLFSPYPHPMGPGARLGWAGSPAVTSSLQGSMKPGVCLASLLNTLILPTT